LSGSDDPIARSDRDIIFAHAGNRMQLIIDSYVRLTGRCLLPMTEANPEKLWEAPFALVAHSTEADPIFFYGNKTAITLFATDASGLIAMPSRLSAKPINRAERSRLFERVAQHGFIDDYAGDRVTTTGWEFRIKQATVWTLFDNHNEIKGHAALFDDWTWL
tara:strand:+ start:16525 stop:17010 length:486 start_codon:yes stop_codon:yes gene_type:complete